MAQQQNATSFLPSPADLLLAVPRLLSKAGALGEHIDGVFGRIRSGGSVVAEPTVANITNATRATTAGKFMQESVTAAAANARLALPEDMNFFQALKNVGTFFSYMTSKWAIATFSIAILLNRTYFYASSRVPLSFDRLHLRLALYLLPLLLFVYRIQSMLQAIRCQSNPEWGAMQYGAAGLHLDIDFAADGGFLWRTSSALLFWEDVEDSCRAVNMMPLGPKSPRQSGSLALLWPLFISLGFGQFVETLSCALQGRHPVPEVGMTIFEHSLAFAEAEAIVSRPFAMDSARFFKPQKVFTPDSTKLMLTRTAVSSFANVPPEVLLICLISSVSHFTSNFLAIAGFRSRFRLVTTGIWGAAYMATFTWSLIRFANNSNHYVGILRFPTVCIVGFIPHLIIIAGIICCGAVYLLAFGITVLNPPPGQSPNLTWRERFATAYGNLHANIHLSAITPLSVSWHEDFYTAVLKVGLTVLTAASEAVYLNEAMRVNVHSSTWLERKRYHEAAARSRQDGKGSHNTTVIESDSQSRSGYARERKTKSADASPFDAAPNLGQEDHGFGLQHRQGRWALTRRFLVGITFLLLFLQARLLVAIMQKLHIAYRPRWFIRLFESRMNDGAKRRGEVLPSERESWLVVNDITGRKARIRPDISFDVETFARDRMRRSGVYDQRGSNDSEEYISSYLYNWWIGGGKWGDVDQSGDYVPSPADDDDTTSVISFSTASDAGEWSDTDDEGQRTPTQSSYQYSRESTPLQDNTLDLAHLSHLLDPQSEKDREEARLLGRHLQSAGVMTRSQHRKLLQSNDARLLASSRYRINNAGPMSPDEEEQVLEEFVLDRRDAAAKSNAGTWDSGAEGMGSEGPQCVVCQLSPRTVLVWPCGCLSLCDECRVGLASKNYTTCVCCRTNVQAYSRLFVP